MIYSICHKRHTLPPKHRFSRSFDYSNSTPTLNHEAKPPKLGNESLTSTLTSFHPGCTPEALAVLCMIARTMLAMKSLREAWLVVGLQHPNSPTAIHTNPKSLTHSPTAHPASYSVSLLGGESGMKNHQRDSKLCKSAQAGGVKERYYVRLFRASSGSTGCFPSWGSCAGDTLALLGSRDLVGVAQEVCHHQQILALGVRGIHCRWSAALTIIKIWGAQ